MDQVDQDLLFPANKITKPSLNNEAANREILKSLKERGLETLKFDELKYTHEPIGEGFWGEVFKIHSGDNVMVLKTSKRSNWQGIKYTLNEVEIMRSLDHPNIVKFLGVCVTDNNQLFPLLEYIDGGTLEDFLQNECIQIPWVTRLGFAMDIANGMKYLHAHNIMHRDLTSSNILLRIKKAEVDNDEVQGEAIISDFGLAKELQKERALSVVGSVDWMAPEVILGKQYNKKADVFSYGIIMCEMIGRCEADPETSVIRTKSFEVDFDDFTKRSCDGCPEGFLNLAKSSCKLDPEERPSFAEVYTICDSIISELMGKDDSMSTRESLEKLNLSPLGDLESTEERVKSPEQVLEDVLENEPRFSVLVDDLIILDDDGDSCSLRSFRPISYSNSLRSKASSDNPVACDDPDRRASIINPIPSVNRNSGKIVLTVRSDVSSPMMDGSVKLLGEPQIPISPAELAMLNDQEESKALDELSMHSTLIIFDPAARHKISKRRTSSGTAKRHNITRSTSQDREDIPFGRRHFSKKKKIRPLLPVPRVFNKSKSPKHDSNGDSPRHHGTTSILSFFKSLKSSGSKSSSDHHSSKSKVAKRKPSDDKESGEVTKFSIPTSPKHTKNSINQSSSNSSLKQEVTPINSIVTSIDPLTPTSDNSMNDITVTDCFCGDCQECIAQERRATITDKNLMSRITVNRNESYRSMRPFRTQSVPTDYSIIDTPDPSAETRAETVSTRPSSRPKRSRSFREKINLSLRSDKSKQGKER